jgi:predicted lipoprotein
MGAIASRGGLKMAYQLKDQDITPPDPDQVERRSVAADGIAAVVMALATLGLIALILSQVID